MPVVAKQRSSLYSFRSVRPWELPLLSWRAAITDSYDEL